MMVLRYFMDKQPSTLAKGETYRLMLHVFLGTNAISVKAVAEQIRRRWPKSAIVRVRDANGPVRDAKVTVQKNGEHGFGQTDHRGELALQLCEGAYTL